MIEGRVSRTTTTEIERDDDSDDIKHDEEVRR